MPSLMPLRRSARGLINEVRATSGAGEGGQDSGSGESIAQSESGEAPWQGSTKRAFLRSLVSTSKAKLASRLQDNRSDKSDHDADKTAGDTVSKTSWPNLHNQTRLDLVLLSPASQTPVPQPAAPPNPQSSDAVPRFHGSMAPWFHGSNSCVGVGGT
ncbi:hypothetical protein F4860DRAFT_99410 [Xylaria cubensis]|nr:hypothetical protein F4860DRAFT_99410 [Xylaria cubensis]